MRFLILSSGRIIRVSTDEQAENIAQLPKDEHEASE
jgi:hypothetical protein